MAGRVAGKIKLQTVDELLGAPEIAGTQEIELGRIHACLLYTSQFGELDSRPVQKLTDRPIHLADLHHIDACLLYTSRCV